MKLRQEVAALQKRQRVGTSAGATVYEIAPIDVTAVAPAATSVDGLTIRDDATVAIPGGASTRAADVAAKVADIVRYAPGAPTTIPPASASAPAALPYPAIAPTVNGTPAVAGYRISTSTLLPAQAPSKNSTKTTKKPAAKPKKKG